MTQYLSLISKSVIAFFVLVCTLVFVNLAHSASAYQVFPLVVDETLSARDSVSVPITIRNNDSRPTRIYPTVNAIAVNESGQMTDFIQPGVADFSNTVTAWLSISRARIEIPPGGTYETNLDIKISPTAEPGEYHAFIGFPSGSNRPKAEQSVVSGIAPGTVVRIEVADPGFTLLNLGKFIVDQFILSEEDRTATIEIENTGTKLTKAEGEIVFYNNSGEEVGAVPVSGQNLEPGVKSSIEVEVPEELAMGKYKAFMNLKYGDTQTANLQDTAFFYVLPLKTLLMILAGLLLATLFIALYIHRRYQYEDDMMSDRVDALPLYVRQGTSESKDHDVDLKTKK